MFPTPGSPSTVSTNERRRLMNAPQPIPIAHHPVAVIGAGQAGLSISWYLKRSGIDHVVFEKKRAGHAWRAERWDTFCLVTPNWQCQLPGFPYQGPDPNGFMLRHEIVDYFDGFVASFSPPLREGVAVEALSSNPQHGFTLETTDGLYVADQVVIAAGGYQIPVIPRCAERLDPELAQINSSEYRNPDQLPDGPVLVVGSGQSGCQIAEDLHLAGRRVHLCVGGAPRTARRYRGKDVVDWLDDMGYYDMPVHEHPQKERVRAKANHYVTGRDGGRDIDLRRFALEGMRLYGPLESVADGRVVFSPGLKRNLDDADDVYRSINRSIDGYIEKSGIGAPVEAAYTPLWEPDVETSSLDCQQAGIRVVVWSVGFGIDFSWVRLPAAFDERGYPRHERGVTPIEGLYFVGLPWLYTWGSGRFCGVGRDALHIVDRIRQVAQQGKQAGASTGCNQDAPAPV